MGEIKIDMYDDATAEIERKDLGEDITNTWAALTEFVYTYECLLALLSNMEDQVSMHQSLKKAQEYLDTLEVDKVELPIERQNEIETFLQEQQTLFDEMEVNQNIGAKGLVADLRIKQEIIGHFMNIAYPEEDEVQVESEPCKYDYMGTYYGTFDREELIEAQHQISEQMDAIDQEYISRKEPSLARGIVRYRTVGTGGNDDDDDDDDNDNDNAKGNYDEDTELEDNNVEKDDDNPDNENLIIMNPNNGTGLQIQNVISVEPMDVDQPKVQQHQEKMKRAVISVDRIDSPQYKDTGATPVPGKQPVLGEQPVPGEDPMAAKQPVPEEDPMVGKQPVSKEPPVTEDPLFVPRVKQTARKSTKQKQKPQKSKKDKKKQEGIRR